MLALEHMWNRIAHILQRQGGGIITLSSIIQLIEFIIQHC